MKYAILVKPGSKKGPKVEEIGGELVVYLREKPHDGEANEALIKILAKHFGVSKTSLKITSGTKSRKKIVEF